MTSSVTILYSETLLSKSIAITVVNIRNCCLATNKIRLWHLKLCKLLNFEREKSLYDAFFSPRLFCYGSFNLYIKIIKINYCVLHIEIIKLNYCVLHIKIR